MKSNPGLSQDVRLIAGTGVTLGAMISGFLLFPLDLYIGIVLDLLVCLVIGSTIGLGTYLFLPRRKSDHEISVLPGVSKRDIKEAVKKCRDSAEKLRNLVINASDEVRNEVCEIADWIDKISVEFERDPRDVVSSKGLTDYYLDRLIGIVEDYVRLSGTVQSDEQSEKLEQIRHKLLEFKPHFEKIHETCLANDLVGLQVTTQTLGDVLRSEVGN